MSLEDRLKQQLERWQKRLDARLMKEALESPSPPVQPCEAAGLTYRPPAPDMGMHSLLRFLQDEIRQVSGVDAFRAMYMNEPRPMTATEIMFREHEAIADEIIRAYRRGYDRARDREALDRRARERQESADRAWLDAPDPVMLMLEEDSRDGD